MRAFFLLGSECADYLIDLTVDGFRQVLGANNVSWWPAKPHLTHEPPTKVPERLCWFEGLYPTVDDAMCGIEGLVEGDILVVGSTHDDAAARLQVMQAGVAQERGVSLVGLDGGDYPAPQWAAQLHDAGATLFLRERTTPNSYAAHPIAIPFNPRFVAPAVPWELRRRKVMWAGANHNNRSLTLDAITADAAAVADDLFDFSGVVLPHEWSSHLAAQAVCLCLPGEGVQTYRYFEAAASGALVLSHGAGGGHADLVDGESALFFDRARHAVTQATRLITSVGREELRVIAAAGYVNAWAHHTPVATARYIIDKVKMA